MADQKAGQDTVVGQTLSHYLIVEKIGAGGTGEVYRARDKHLSRDVAIKVLPRGALITGSSRKHFRTEALLLSKLNHPNVTTIHDFDTEHGVDFLVMEYIPGTTLSKKLATESFSEKEVVRVGVQLAEGLAAAHEQGIVHRDLKPGNLRLTSDGRLKILDFGLASLLHPAKADATMDSETQSIMAGTLPYMAPEQLSGAKIDSRTDIHAAGSVLYEMATGQRPFAEVERSQLISAILRQTPQPPTAVNPRLSPELERIITKCLEKEPENRYQSAKELAVDLRRLARDTESGYHRAEASAVPPSARILRKRPVLAMAGAIGIALLVVATFWLMRRKEVPGITQITPSIAVLPFTDLSQEKDQEYFSDGLAEELLNSLVKIQGLQVAARSSSFQFKGKNEDLRAIGQKLNVATVLEGSVRKQGQRVRINAQLIKVSDGFHLWSGVYDRDLTDIFAVQEEIARSVAGSLRLTLLGAKLPSLSTTNIEAYNAYLQGKYFYASPTKENLEKAIVYYKQAISLDPNYSPAWAALSRSYGLQAGVYSTVDEYGEARKAAQRSLELDPSLAQAHLALGQIQQNYDWDWAAADASYQRALALEPGNAEVLQAAAGLAAILNHFDQALVWSRRGVELDPLQASSYHALAFYAWWAGRLDESEAAVRKGLEVDPQFPWLHAVLSRVYLARSRPQEALAEAEQDTTPELHLQGLALAYHVLARKEESDRAQAQLVAKYGKNSAFQIAEVCAYRGEVEAAFTWLDRAYIQRDGGLTFMKGDPLMANLERDPRYIAILKKMRLFP
jgi:serine/threonine protein kinase/Tfp pilus assembly protein PilF